MKKKCNFGKKKIKKKKKKKKKKKAARETKINKKI